MNQTLSINKHQQSNHEAGSFQASLTQFSTVVVQLMCIQINRQLTLQLDHNNCLEDITGFLTEQKIVGKATEINYLLSNNPSPLNTLWTLRQIMETFDLVYADKIVLNVQIKEEDDDYGRFQKKKQACCKCEIY